MKKAMFAAAATAALMVMSVPAAHADEKKVGNPWAECGLGAMVFPDNGTAAAISNVIWDWGTTAVSSSLSSADQCQGGKVKTAMLIGNAYASLEAETAAGEGKYLTAVADSMGCDKSVHSALAAEIRVRFSDVAARPEYIDMTKAQKAEAYYNIVDTAVSTKFAAQCSVA
ncbi:DUF3015 family protein [Asticcacaulis excentricus]|nr:DUF3015 family protein [Asticcacaulis excentricus]